MQFDFENYAFIIFDEFYRCACWNSLKLAGISTFFCLIIGYPMAYSIVQAKTPRRRFILLTLAILPFWTSFLTRVYAWVNLLSKEGVINHFLQMIGIIDEPIPLMHNDFATATGIIYTYLPFMIFPLYVALEKIERSLLEAAFDLGCKPFMTFWKITVPLSFPGIFAGISLVFIPAVGEYIIPEILGGTKSLTIGSILWSEFFINRDWPVACSLAIIMVILLFIPIVLLELAQKMVAKRVHLR